MNEKGVGAEGTYLQRRGIKTTTKKGCQREQGKGDRKSARNIEGLVGGEWAYPIAARRRRREARGKQRQCSVTVIDHVSQNQTELHREPASQKRARCDFILLYSNLP